MSNPWVVEPEDVKVELEWTTDEGETHPFWIRVKKYLSVGEQRRMMKDISIVTAPVRTKDSEPSVPEAKLEWTEYSFARCRAYLLDWSLADENDKKLPVTRATLESFHSDLFDLIDNAIDDHESALAEKKKAKQPKKKSKTTSPS
jgi:hypothetical protein